MNKRLVEIFRLVETLGHIDADVDPLLCECYHALSDMLEMVQDADIPVEMGENDFTPLDRHCKSSHSDVELISAPYDSSAWHRTQRGV